MPKRQFAVFDPFCSDKKNAIVSKCNTEKAARKWLKKRIAEDWAGYAGCIVMPIISARKELGLATPAWADNITTDEAFSEAIKPVQVAIALSPWFPVLTPPTRKGMYRVQDHTMHCACCWSDAMWDGEQWLSDLHTKPYFGTVMYDVKRWRGTLKME